MTIQSSTYKAIKDYRNAVEDNPAYDALSGDIIIQCSPATTTRAATAAAFSRDVVVSLVNTAGEVHTWFDGDLAVAATDSSTAGTAAIADSATTVTLVDGVGTITLEGDAAAWLAGTAQVETATAAGTITAAGNAAVVVTSAAVTGSPVTVNVAVAVDDNAAAIAGKIRTALAANAAIAAKFTVGGATDKVVLTRNASPKVANDATLNISIDNGTGEGACEGITTAATSANTTAGVVAETNTLTVSKNESIPILGSVVAATSVESIV